MKTEHTYRLIYDAINNLREVFEIRELRTLKKLAQKNYFVRHLLCGTYLLETNISEQHMLHTMMVNELALVLKEGEKYANC